MRIRLILVSGCPTSRGVFWRLFVVPFVRLRRSLNRPPFDRFRFLQSSNAASSQQRSSQYTLTRMLFSRPRKKDTKIIHLRAKVRHHDPGYFKRDCRQFERPLRDVRHLIRASRQDRQPVPQDLPDILFGKAARAMDKALTAAETISISLVSQDPAAHSTTIEARSLDVYFPADAGKGEALFRRDVYYLTKRILSVLGSHNALIHEFNIRIRPCSGDLPSCGFVVRRKGRRSE